MIKEFLKIAGVKNEKQFYNKYPSEAAFFKAHPDAKHLKSFKKGGEMKKLEQLTDFGNPPIAKKGKEVPKLQNSIAGGIGLNTGTALGANPTGGFDWSMGANVPITGGTPPPTLPGGNAQGMYQVSDFNRQGIQKDIMSTMNKKQGFDLLGKLGGPEGIGQLAGGVIQAVQNRKSRKAKEEDALKSLKIAKLTREAVTSKPKEPIKRYYYRQDENPVATAEVTPKGFYQGTNTEILSSAKDGAMIGGNSTEIQNMYNPGDLYSNLGYEPMSESDVIKQYEEGGYIPKAQLGGIENLLGQAGSALGGGDTSGMVSAIGNVAGKFIPGVGAIAQFAQGAINRERQKALEKVINEKQNILNTTAFESGASAFAQGTGAAKNGASIDSDYEWISHTWQPQVITKFGDVDVSDIHSIATEGMDTLRTGGRITQNNMYPQDQFNFGGQLQTTWGGHAEPISYNPYLPGTGETVMFKGNSHEESDRKGRTGIGVKYGNDGGYSPYMEYGKDGIESKTDVEVERGEPATELQDSTGDTSMVVFGNLKIPRKFIDTIGDPNAKGKKFKHYAANLSEQEAKQNKLIEKAMKLIDIYDDGTPFDNITLDSVRATVEGAKQKLWQIAQFKNNAALVQNAINETAEEHGIDADALSKGKIVPDKEAMAQQAKWGKAIKKADDGVKKKPSKTSALETVRKGQHKAGKYYGNVTEEQYKQLVENNKDWFDFTGFDPSNKSDVKRFQQEFNKFSESIGSKARLKDDGKLGEQTASAKVDYTNDQPTTTVEKKTETTTPTTTLATTTPTTDKTTTDIPVVPTQEKKKPDWLAGLNTLLPYLQKPYEAGMPNLYPEMMALSTNTLEPVKAQGVQPLLETPYDISLQDQLNEITSSERAAQKMSMGDPSALANIAAQSQAAKSKVLADQFRMNQAEKAGVYGRNRQTLNQAQLENLQIFADQEQKQQLAKSKTKATALEAMGSMADKMDKRRAEERNVRLLEQAFPNYRLQKNMQLTPSQLTLFDVGSTGVPAGATPPYVAPGRTAGATTAQTSQLAPSTSSSVTSTPTQSAYYSEADLPTIEDMYSEETAYPKEQKRGGKIIKKKHFNGSIVKALKNI